MVVSLPSRSRHWPDSLEVPLHLLFVSIGRAFPGLLLFFAATLCQAGSIQLTPVQINLSGVAKVAALIVQNTGEEESVMQVTLNKWDLDGQNYTYQQSQELIVTPATFRVLPGKQQIVRIGLRGSPPADKEAAYRLLVEEVPPPPSSDVTQMRFVVRHDLPVFVSPLKAARSGLEAVVDCSADGARLRLTNIGNIHVKLRNLVLEDISAGEDLGRWETFDYLLPDAQKSWALSKVAPKAVGKNFLITMVTEQGAFTVDVKNTCH